MKHDFSIGSDEYARYRPTYPDALFAYLATLSTRAENAWDCATGNGQAAQKLAAVFTRVYATDSSPAQLANAIQLPNIQYSVQPAESASFSAGFFDMIMVAQAVHWLDFEAFYAEVRRTAKAHALLVICGYGRIMLSPELDAIVNHFYFQIIGPFWDKRRRYIDEQYQTIPFPFEELPPPSFNITCQWTLEHLIGYLKTWSAVKNYQNKNGSNPVDAIEEDLQQAWGEIEKRTISFPLLLRIGKVNS